MVLLFCTYISAIAEEKNGKRSMDFQRSVRAFRAMCEKERRGCKSCQKRRLRLRSPFSMLFPPPDKGDNRQPRCGAGDNEKTPAAFRKNRAYFSLKLCWQHKTFSAFFGIIKAGVPEEPRSRSLYVESAFSKNPVHLRFERHFRLIVYITKNGNTAARFSSIR